MHLCIQPARWCVNLGRTTVRTHTANTARTTSPGTQEQAPPPNAAHPTTHHRPDRNACPASPTAYGHFEWWIARNMANSKAGTAPNSTAHAAEGPTSPLATLGSGVPRPSEKRRWKLAFQTNQEPGGRSPSNDPLQTNEPALEACLSTAWKAGTVLTHFTTPYGPRRLPRDGRSLAIIHCRPHRISQNAI
jgi:hypothetical protein